MSIGTKDSAGTYIGGTHFEGPLLGSDRSGGGAHEDMPLGSVDKYRSPYKVYSESFDFLLASAATAVSTQGVTVTDINTATAPTQSILGANRYLLLNPGTKANAGTEFQFLVAPTAPRGFSSPGAIISTTTLMLGRELVYHTRVGFSSDSATVWDGQAIFGVFTTDTSLMNNSTGVPSVATGGGIGFHIGQTGVFTYLGQQTAITAVGATSLGNISSKLAAANTFYWYTFGFRARWNSTTIANGTIHYFVNGARVASVNSTDMPFQSTQTYSITYGIHNGAAQQSDMAVDSYSLGISRAV